LHHQVFGHALAHCIADQFAAGRCTGRTIVVVIERQWLLAVARILGVIQVENQALGALAKLAMNCSTRASLTQ
jgi:hypothetical protein